MCERGGSKIGVSAVGKKEMKTGILGGTFNPPHIGHFVLASEVKYRLELDRVIFMPAHVSPLKGEEETADPGHRFRMLEEALPGEGYEVSDLEISRGGISYTIDTVKELQRRRLDEEMYLIIGADQAAAFDSWKAHRELTERTTVVVAKRKTFPLPDDSRFRIVEIPQLEVSSSEIRRRVKRGEPVRYLVPETVRRYMMRHRLYMHT
ncbi:MAG: nicotinate (nicotinamide) nucleotide adenylyltransferase [Candidatus Omnitrophica bacterium]|nr:nicotinate (nicotinamide) nucleotide adenylyltransferase [Candidatus Omnitrophota bacterium]